jgi:hypothetical protein
MKIAGVILVCVLEAILRAAITVFATEANLKIPEHFIMT